jgi:hypothetical protein
MAENQRETQRHRDHRVKCSGSLCVLCASVVQSLCFGETVTIALLKNLSIRSLFFLHRGLRTVSFIQSVRIHPDI